MSEEPLKVQRPALASLNACLDVGRAFEVQPWLDDLLSERDPDAVMVVIRAWRQLGRERSADALSLANGRRFAEHGPARMGMLRTVLSNAGSFFFWQRLKRWPQAATLGSQDQAEWLSLKAMWLAGLRDDRAALSSQDQALALVADDPWLWIERSYVLDRLDQREEALAAAMHALTLQPGYRTGVLQIARLLQVLKRPDEAMEILVPAHAATGNGAFAWQLHGLVSDRQHALESLKWLDETQRGLPLADKAWCAALAARRADAHLQLGNVVEAQEYAAAVPGKGFYSQLAERLKAALSEGKVHLGSRTVLHLSMVQQHWMTCAPATLTALAAYWGRPADHVEVAQAICYDGTPQASERNWARSQGFEVREFKLDWATSIALIEAGVPFALATQYVGGGHLQAVVGVDLQRETLLVRDPAQPLHAEYAAEALFAQQQAAGPRALVMLPTEQLGRLQGIELPEVEQWDWGHAVLEAQLKHDRDSAAAALARLEALAPHSDATWRARRHMAIYDGDEPSILMATEELLRRYPEDRSLQLSRLHSLFEVQGQAAGEAWLAELASRPHPDPAVLLRWAGRLRLDSRRRAMAEFVVRRTLWRDQGGGRAWNEWAEQQWDFEGVEQAVLPYRWASSLQPTDEWAAANFARACRVSGDSEQGLAWLRQRNEIWGDRSGAPAVTLSEALDVLQRDHEADQVLQAALLRRPQDNTLRLHMAERALFVGDRAQCSQLLSTCTEAKAPALLRVWSLLHEARGELDAALQKVREAVQLEPFNLPLHRLLLRLLRRRHGDTEALRQWRPLADAHPAHWGLQSLLYDALPDVTELVNAQLDHMHQHHPEVPWLRRERAAQAARQNRLDESIALAEQALALAPFHAVSHQVLAYCHRRKSGYAAAVPHLHAALARDAEYLNAMQSLLDAPDVQQARAAADFIATELRRQPLLGDGLLNFQAESQHAWAPQEILDFLSEQQVRWPHLWQAPVAVALQLQRMQQLDRSLELLSNAALRFPALPRLHVETAETLRLLGRIDEAKAANAKALNLVPGWRRAVRLQVDLLQGWGRDMMGAEAVLRRALQTRESWDDADLIGLLGWLLVQQDRHDEAVVEFRRSLCLDPSATWVWRLLSSACDRAETPAVFDAALEEVVASRPGDAAAWLVRAEHERDAATALTAAEQALALQSRNEAAWMARFNRLDMLGRHEDIDQLLQDLPWPAPVPMSLRLWATRYRWRRGLQQEAIEQLRLLRQEAPHDLELCLQLADWLDERDDHPGYLEQAEALLQIAPLEARSHAYVGHAMLKCGRPAPALLPLKRALELSPDYAFAARQLVQASLKVNARDDAEAALQVLWEHTPDVNTACDGLEIALHARDEARELAWFERLLSVESFDIDRCRATLMACRRSSSWEKMARIQEAQIKKGAGPLGLVMDWLESAGHGGYYATLWAGWRMQGAAVGPYVPIAFMRWMSSRLAGLALRIFIQRFEAVLRAEPNVWGEVSFALVSLGMHRRVVTWLSDWRQRDRPPLFALSNLAGSMVVLKHWAGLDSVVHAMLERAPYHEDARLWALLLAARQGDLDQLEALLGRCHEWVPEDWMTVVLQGLRDFLSAARSRCDESDLVRFRRTFFLESETPQARSALNELRHQLVWRHTPWPRLWRWL